MKEIIEALNWRYATKRFDPSRKLSNEQIEILKESLRLTPSSYGLQPLYFIVVEDESLREQLMEASYGQRQVLEASHLFVFCSHTNISHDHIDEHANNTAQIRKIEKEATNKYADFLKREVNSMDQNEQKTWNEKQCYIALGQFLTVCAIQQIDAIPMEGFDSAKYDDILNLNERGIHATLVCPVGYRNPEDRHQFNAKVRKIQDMIFETI